MIIETMETAEILKMITAMIESYSYDKKEYGREINVLNNLYNEIIERSVF